jgi:hypothetical protein
MVGSPSQAEADCARLYVSGAEGAPPTVALTPAGLRPVPPRKGEGMRSASLRREELFHLVDEVLQVEGL